MGRRYRNTTYATYDGLKNQIIIKTKRGGTGAILINGRRDKDCICPFWIERL
jgi:hypothetical protein